MSGLIFSREDWMEQARLLLPAAEEAQLEALWADVERLDAEHERERVERALAAGRKWMIENI